MRLTNVAIRNFRCIRELNLDLDEITVFIGENNTGKTAVLEAIRTCMERSRGRGRGPFNEYDYHLAEEGMSPAEAAPIQIDLSFVDSDEEPWADEVRQALEEVVTLDAEDRARIALRVTSSFDSEAGEFATNWSFLDANGEDLPGPARSPIQLINLQRMAPVFYLSALRDASIHFASKGKFWRTFLAELGVPEGERRELEEELAALNQRLIEAHRPLFEVRSELESAKDVIDFGVAQAVTVEALPTKLFSLLSRAQVHLASRSGARIPVAFQGEGTQSLAVLVLFGAFLRSQISNLDPQAEAITALEEPEAHLHPSAIRSLMSLVGGLPGQKLISTHSGDLLASVNASAIRRLAHKDGEVKAFRIKPGTLAKEEERKFDFHVRRARGELLFAKCWLLVEGETETTLLTGAANELGLDLDRTGVFCVEYSQTNVGMLAKVANQLGIAWYCVMDGDSGQQKYERAVRAQLNGEPEADRLALPYENIELLLCESGFGDLYEKRMSKQKDRPSAQRDTLTYWREVLMALPKGYSKPEIASEAVARMLASEDAMPVPETLERILRKAIELAGK